MSLSGSPLSDRSTIKMFGLAATDSDCTALRSPPLAHFSGCQPISMTTGRRVSSAVSSQMKAANGSRPPAPGFQGAFMVLVPSASARAAGLQLAGAGVGLFTIGLDRLGRAHDDGLAAARLTRQQVLGIGDHRREVAVDRAAVAG